MRNTSTFFRFVIQLKIYAAICCLMLFGLLSGQTQTVTFTTAGLGSWVVPVGVTSITVEAWGAGGGGQRSNGNPSAGGGGSGGGFVKATRTVIPGSTINFFVGSGGSGDPTSSGIQNGEASWFVANNVIYAVGGRGAGSAVTSGNTWGTGTNALTSGNLGGNVTSTYGGNGGNAGNNYSGGGGSSAGDVNGNNGSGSTAGAAPVNGYAGASGRDTNGDGANGGVGAGGSGGRAGNFFNRLGGSGGNGQIKITYTGYCVPPASTNGCDGDNISSVYLGDLSDTGLSCTPQYATREHVQNAVPNLFQNSTMPMSVGVGNGGTEHVGVWIDFNQNGVFESTEYTPLGSGNNTIINGNINIPADATLGITYMRVRSRYNAAPGGANACVAFGYGTTRDYKVNITGIPPATLDYTDGFENSPHLWTLINGTQTNKWFVGTAVNNGGIRSLYVSNNTSGNNNNYSTTASVVHAYRDIAIPSGVSQVSIYYDWRARGNPNDYFNVWLVPQSFTPTAGTGITVGGGRILLNNNKYYGAANPPFITELNDNVNVSSFAGQNMRLVFEWINTNATVNNTAVAIDNIQVQIPCSGTPTGGTSSITPGTGAPSSNFNVSVTGSSTASGLSYQWQVAESAIGPWTDIAGATSVGTTTLTAVPLASTTRYYRRKITCMNGGGVAYSSTVSFTTTGTTYNNGTTQSPAALYISNLSIVGTMMDPPANNNTGAGTNGYSNFTTLPQIAQQAQGEGVNVIANVGGNVLGRGRWKAWVDWNGNGIFDSSEQVYSTGGFVGATANFGFVVPANQEPGNYRMRIRVNNGLSRTCIPFLGCFPWSENYGYDFGPNDNFTNTSTEEYYGETEDYLIKVVANCISKIATVTSASECGVTGGRQVTLSASSTTSVTEFRWYDAVVGGNLVATTYPDGSGMSTTFLTNPLSATTTFYVTAYNGNCESTFRTAVKAEIKPTPEISFTPSTMEICGGTTVIAVSATGSKEIVHLVNENFEGGALGVFTLVQASAMDSNTTAVKNNTKFQNRVSVFPPAGNVWFPAISSGFGANKFVLATSDSNPAPSSPVQSAIALTKSVSTIGLDNLTLKLRMFYSRYWQDNYNPTTPTSQEEYVVIEVSTNGGTTYNNQIVKLITNQGLGSNFKTLTYDLSAFIGQANLKFRIRHYSWAGTGFLPDGVAVDDIELFGEKPLQPSFVWTPSNPIGVYTDAAGSTEYTGGPISTIYFKPSDEQIRTYENWNVSATANLSNSCSAVGSITIVNNTKIWDTNATNWFTSNWLPNGNGASTANKCVVVKTPVTINANEHALAKNIKIETASGATGQLTVNGTGSLTVTDAIVNTGAPRGVIVKSDGNLLQINPDPNINSTSIAVRRLHALTTPAANGTRKEYNFLSSPVAGQSMNEIFGGAGNVAFVTKLNEANNSFVNAAAGDYQIKGKGFAVKEPKSYTAEAGLTNNEAEYRGIPNNGNITVDLDWSAPSKGYNVVGNPYPSNVDIIELYANSTQSLIDPTFRFWDNTVNHIYVQMGGSYQGYSYALFNALTDTDGYGIAAPGRGGLDEHGNPYPAGTKVPNRVIKVSQAFMVRALGSGAKLNFSNTQRKTSYTGTVFYGKQSTKDRYRLQLVKDDGFTIQNGIAYFAAGNYGFGREDTRIPNSQASDALFSYADDAKVVINGRAAFNNDDVVTLGLRHFVAGTYKIEAVDLEGVFANGQSIYLKDKVLGILTDLAQGPYSFTSNAGEFTNRFEVVYKPQVILATADSQGNGAVNVYSDAGDFVVKSSAKIIDAVEIYDASGRMILTQDRILNKEFRFSANRLVDGMYVIKVRMTDGEILSKKIRR